MSEPSRAEHSAEPRSNRTVKRGVAAAIVIAALLIGAGGGYLAAMPQLRSAQAEASNLQSALDKSQRELSSANADKHIAESDLDEATATIEKLTAGLDPVVLDIDFPMPEGYPQLVDVSTVPSHMRDALDAGTGKVVAVAPGVWASFPPGATVESAVNALAFDGYCASKLAFEEQYLGGNSTSGSCW